MIHRVAIDAAAVEELTPLSSLGEDRNPWISADGGRIYFSRDLGPPSNSDIYLASRLMTTLPFTGPGTSIANLNSGRRENRVALTPDELTVVLSTDRDGPLDIHMNTRMAGQVIGTAEATHLAMVNTLGTQRIDPFISADGLRLYLASDTGPSSKLQLLVASRPTTSDDFGAPSFVPGIDDSAVNQTDPTLSRDEQLLVYSAFPTSGTGSSDLWYATRSTATGNFGAPDRVPAVNTGDSEFDPALSSDGCDLYFASTRRGGKFHLFHARVSPTP